jgi:hypothetical protein
VYYINSVKHLLVAAQTGSHEQKGLFKKFCVVVYEYLLRHHLRDEGLAVFGSLDRLLAW